MSKPQTGTPKPPTSEADSNRRRAAWFYYTHGLTQREVAERLGISRSTVIRMLEDARARGEVQITVPHMPQDCAGLEAELEMEFGLKRALVVPESPNATPQDIANGVGTALGRYLSDRITDDMVIGIGWGRTLRAATENLPPAQHSNVTVLSLLGGPTSSRDFNASDVSWQMAQRIGADCLMMPAPLLVNSPETKRTLIEDCGLKHLFDMARSMDLAVISCGETIAAGTSLTEGFIPAADYQSALEQGAVADVMCHFLDPDGNTVTTPVSERVMSIAPDDIAQAAEVVLACGGENRATAIRASLRRFKCQVLVTDAPAARALLDLG